MAGPQRWGLIGASRIAQDFGAALKRTPGAVLQAVTSRDANNARRFAHDHGFAVAHPTINEFLADPAIDVVYLAAPTRLHHTLGVAVLDANKHLLCEKPFTANEEQAADLVARARARRLFCMEAMWLRFNVAVAQCRDDLAASRLGRLSSVTIEVGYGKDLTQLGGPGDGRGAALVFGCYGLSLALHLFGLPNESRCVAKRDAAGVDVDSAYLLGYDNHLVSIVSSVAATLSNELCMFGSQAKIILPSPFLDATERILIDNETSPWVRRARVLSDPIRRRLPAAEALRASGLRGEAAEVMRCLDEGLLESPVIPLEHTLAVHRLLAHSDHSETAAN